MEMGRDIVAINEQVNRESAFVESLVAEIGKVIVGQHGMVERLIIAMLCNGHVLLEGVPGLAKTLSVITLARTIQASFGRIQFTPDLLPADLIGTMIFHQGSGKFVPKKGPIFANLILADEVNRAPRRSKAPCWRRCRNAR